MNSTVETPAKPGEPYCSECGYVLTGLTDSSKCPECGRPIVDVLTRKGMPFVRGKRYRSTATLFGLPVIDVALGPAEGEMRGKAKGIIAIGDIATGGIAIGGIARGVVALGGMAFGFFSLGGLAVGLLTAAGGGAIGGLAFGGGAVGVVANGGGAAGVIAQGGGAIGWFVRDARSFTRGYPPLFKQYSWFFGPWPPVQNQLSGVMPMLVVLGTTVAVAAIIGLMAVWGLSRDRDKVCTDP